MRGVKCVAALAFFVGVAGVLVGGSIRVGYLSQVRCFISNTEMMWLGGLSLALAVLGGAVLFATEKQDQ